MACKDKSFKDYIYIEDLDESSSNIDKIEFDMDDDDYKVPAVPFNFQYKPLDYSNYEFDAFGNLDFTK